MNKTILIIGNPTNELDSYPTRILNDLTKSFPRWIFVHWDPSEELPPDTDSSVICIDTVIGIKQPQKFTTIEEFSLSPRNTVHDFDLCIALKLLVKIKKLRSVIIIGVPIKENNNTYSQLCTILRSI
jgi:hypothetical protein